MVANTKVRRNILTTCLPQFSHGFSQSTRYMYSVLHLSFLFFILCSLLLLQAHYVLLSQALWGPTFCCSEETMPAEREVVWGPTLPRRGPFALLPQQPHRQSHMEKAQGEGMKKRWDEGYFMGIVWWKKPNVHNFHFKRTPSGKTCLLADVLRL